MADFLAELFDQFDQEEQGRIRAAEASATERLDRAAATVRDWRQIVGSRDDPQWVLQLEGDARRDSAEDVFVAYVNALWGKTDAERVECIHDFQAKADELIDPILKRYGSEGEDRLVGLCEYCRTGAKQIHAVLTSPVGATASVSDSASTSQQNGTDHGEASAATEQPGPPGGQTLGSDHPAMRKPQTILDSLDSRRWRKRHEADLNALYKRIRRSWPASERGEKLLETARRWAGATLKEVADEVLDVLELKERVVKKTYDKFVSTNRSDPDFWDYGEFESALWEEGWPSLGDRANAAIQERVSSSAKEAASLSVEKSGSSERPALGTSGNATAPPIATELQGPYQKRAAWLAAELAIRDWNVHDLEAQRGPNWKTSRKVLDGLAVSRSVLEKIAAALSSLQKQVLFKDIPID